MPFLPVLWLGQFRSEKIRSWPRARSPRGRTPTEAVSGHSPQVPRPGPRACRQLGVDSRDHGPWQAGAAPPPPAGTSALSERDFYFPALSTNDHCDCHDSPSQGGKPSSLRTSKSKHFNFPPRPHSHIAIPVRLPRGGPFRRDPWWLYIAPPEVSAVKAALTAAQGALHTFSTELENAGTAVPPRSWPWPRPPPAGLDQGESRGSCATPAKATAERRPGPGVGRLGGAHGPAVDRPCPSSPWLVTVTSWDHPRHS